MKLFRLLRKLKRLINGEISTETLVSRGMRVGRNFQRGGGSFIDPSHCFLIEIGDDVVMSINVTILAHDASTKGVVGYTKIGKVRIGNGVFIGAGTTILPNVNIGDNTVIGAGSVVTHNIGDNVVAAGNPARPICSIQEYREKHKSKMKDAILFPEEYTMRHKISPDMIAKMQRATEGKIDYIK